MAPVPNVLNIAMLFINCPTNAMPDGPIMFETTLIEMKEVIILKKVAIPDQTETFTNSVLDALIIGFIIFLNLRPLKEILNGIRNIVYMFLFHTRP